MSGGWGLQVHYKSAIPDREREHEQEDGVLVQKTAQKAWPSGLALGGRRQSFVRDGGGKSATHR